MSRPTIKDIAAEAGVALGTASRALSGNGSVAAGTRERVLDAAERLNYIPNAQARSLRSERTETIGLLIPDVRNPFFAELAHVVEREARASGLSVVLCSANEDPELMREYMLVLRRQRVDGIIVAPFSTAHVTLTPSSRPGCRWSSWTAPSPAWTCPPSSPIPAPRSARPSRTSWAGERSAWDSSPAPPRPPPVWSAWPSSPPRPPRRASRPSSSTATSRRNPVARVCAPLLETGVDAVLTADSRMTLGAVRVCLEAGITPSADLPFVGFDDIAPSPCCNRRCR